VNCVKYYLGCIHSDEGFGSGVTRFDILHFYYLEKGQSLEKNLAKCKVHHYIASRL